MYFFKGKIRFALYCIGVKVEDLSLVNYEEEFDISLLESVYKVVLDHLSTSEISNKFRRALLTIRDNTFYNYWHSWSYGTQSHKRCLIENTSDLKNNFTQNYRHYLKDLLLKLVEKSVDEIINEYSCPDDMPNWKCRLIKEPELLDNYCQSHYFGFTHDNIYLLYGYKKRPRSRDECEIVK